MPFKRSDKEILDNAVRYGIDVSLLRERLGWTLEERIQRHQAALALADALRHAKRKPSSAGGPAAAHDIGRMFHNGTQESPRENA